ncbi:MAG: S9 family peptidase [bacterium]|nr:MAG: S9 family peptidase [bacterium]
MFFSDCFARRKFAGILQFIFIAVFIATGHAVSAAAFAGERPPETIKESVVDTLHGVVIADPYRWLEDQDSPETREWIDKQNEYTHSYIDELSGRDKLVKRLTELMKTDLISIPRERNGRYFLSRRDADQEQFIIYMRNGLDGEDEVLIDPHPMSEDKSISVNLLDVSEDGTLMAYGVREGGADEVAVKFFDVDAKKHLSDELPSGHYFGISITRDNTGFYYSKYNFMIGSRIYYHEMGSSIEEDVEIFGEGFGPQAGIGAGITEDGRYLAIVVFHGSAAQKTEVYYKDLEKDGPVVPLVNDIDAKFIPGYGGGAVYLHTDWEAPKGRVLRVDPENHARENWKEVIPETEAVIEGVTLSGGKLCVRYLENVVSKVKIFEPDGKFVREITFPTLGTVGEIRGKWESDEAFFIFTSFHVPTAIYRYQVGSGEKNVWAKLNVPVNSDDIVVKQVWYESKDDTRIPMFIVHAKDVIPDGNNPLLLVGYGGFNVSLTPGFRATGVLWTEMGGVFAVPNLRGGGEFGEEWHRAGMFEKKQNTFDDFIAAAEWLTDNGYTLSSRLAIRGGSNGGLLVGAALVQRPDLFKAVVCTYPLLDMLRYQKFLMGRFWISEYGSADDPEQFKYIYKYSPYHNVRMGENYPATLFVTGDSDTRVSPLHARKMAALLQEANASNNPVMLLYDTKAGHSGGKPLSKQIEDTADEMMFLLWQLGMLN